MQVAGLALSADQKELAGGFDEGGIGDSIARFCVSEQVSTFEIKDGDVPITTSQATSHREPAAVGVNRKGFHQTFPGLIRLRFLHFA